VCSLSVLVFIVIRTRSLLELNILHPFVVFIYVKFMSFKVSVFEDKFQFLVIISLL
jgi:hypothetical protein